ncbi:MAG: hypothetical protein M0P39_05015 [Rhodocyclaceae bacterium]|jgi:hypothetical protein|nr:hypothetical protein [Rhodocyclaceae bacterium]
MKNLEQGERPDAGTAAMCRAAEWARREQRAGQSYNVTVLDAPQSNLAALFVCLPKETPRRPTDA